MMDFLGELTLFGIVVVLVLIVIYMGISIAHAWELYKEYWGKKNDD